MPQEVMNNIVGILPKDEKLVVVDPFMGSGTTGIACKKYDVDFIGIELDTEYFKIAQNRIEGYGEQISLF
jgi:DNA modification methylase